MELDNAAVYYSNSFTKQHFQAFFTSSYDFACKNVWNAKSKRGCIELRHRIKLDRERRRRTLSLLLRDAVLVALVNQNLFVSARSRKKRTFSSTVLYLFCLFCWSSTFFFTLCSAAISDTLVVEWGTQA